MVPWLRCLLLFLFILFCVNVRLIIIQFGSKKVYIYFTLGVFGIGAFCLKGEYFNIQMGNGLIFFLCVLALSAEILNF